MPHACRRRRCARAARRCTGCPAAMLKNSMRAVVHGHPDRVPVGAAHLLVHVDDGLHEVLARRQRGELLGKPTAPRRRRRRRPGGQLLDVDAEDRWPAWRHGRRGSGCRRLRDQQHQPAGERAGVRGGGHGDLEAGRLRRGGRGGGDRAARGEGEAADRSSGHRVSRARVDGHVTSVRAADPYRASPIAPRAGGRRLRRRVGVASRLGCLTLQDPRASASHESDRVSTPPQGATRWMSVWCSH